ncbi:hypothetical protein A0H81_01445 [Grifola frondosa]|uniref:Uncharacterized protein n=1 Tax=Grifola frondosa TaxID=5627 RepID=A0A1C7MQB7_GRIFR|nr:hypothetical protein A0H81_01445 [Grifola frondosa]
MLAHLRNVSSRKAGSSTACAFRRQFTFNAVLHDEREKSRVPSKGYENWLTSDGQKYREPYRPRNWLGGHIPFPLNPTFKPPTPISNHLRTIIYNEYIGPLEEGIVENKPIQTGFVQGMENILGITEDIKQHKMQMHRGALELGSDATEADTQSEDGNEAARHRYQRLFWEPVVEGQEPILPAILAKSRADAEKHSKAEAEARSNEGLTVFQHEESHEHIVERPGRPSIKFVDVGGKFLNIREQMHRRKDAERRHN